MANRDAGQKEKKGSSSTDSQYLPEDKAIRKLYEEMVTLKWIINGSDLIKGQKQSSNQEE